MTVELTILAIGCLFGIAQIIVAAEAEALQRGFGWAVSSRETEPPPWSPLVGRLKRAQANYLETFPIFAVAVLIVEVAGISSSLTRTGAIIWIAARAGFWLAYAIGIPVIRSLLFATSLIGIGMVLWPALF